MGIGRRIKLARENKHLTQKQLGELVGVTGNAITNYENDVSHPKEPVLYKLFEVLDVDADFLFYDYIKNKKPATNGDELSDKEYKIALAYRTASDDDKAVVDVVLKKYMNPNQNTVEKAI